MVTLEFSGRRMPLTSSAGGDDVIRAAAQAGLFDHPDAVPLDVLSVPHYGSKHNVDLAFLDTVKSDRYVFQCNVSHMLPSPEVIQRLAEARRGDDYNVYSTRRDYRNGG